ncbi:MAG: hypothetical protein HQM02_05945 [Magnetococcales bacterium]|nr:hypothetical protein [Magnetococcales bacterium]
MIFLFLILLTAAQFNFRLAGRLQTGEGVGAPVVAQSAETRKLRASNAELTAQLLLKDSQIKGLQQKEAITPPGTEPNKEQLPGDVQEQSKRIEALTEDRAVLMSQLNRRNREMNRLLQGALTLRGAQAESEQNRALLQEKAALAQRLLEQDDALLRIKQENERLVAAQEEKNRLTSRVAEQEREVTALQQDRAILAERDAEQKKLLKAMERLDQEIVRLQKDHGGMAGAEKELLRLQGEKKELVTRLSRQEQQSLAMRQEMARTVQSGGVGKAGAMAGLAELQGELANQTARSSAQEKRIQAMEQEKAALEEGIRQRDMELTKLRANGPEVVEAIQGIDPEEMKRQLAARQAEIRGLQEENERLNKKHQDLAGLEQEKKRLQTTIEGRDAQIAQLRGEIARLAAGSEELSRSTAGMQKAKSELEVRIREQDERIAELKKEGQVLAAKAGLEDLLKGLHQEKEELMEWLRRDEEEIGRLRQDNGRLAVLAGRAAPGGGTGSSGEVDAPRELFRELSQLKEQLRKQGMEMSALLDNKESLQKAMQQMSQDVLSMRNSPEQAGAPMAALQSERDGLQAKVRERDETIKQLQKENSALAVSKSVSESVRTLQAEQGELKELLARRTNELEILKRENTKLHATLAAQLPVKRTGDTGALGAGGTAPSSSSTGRQPQTLDELMAQLDPEGTSSSGARPSSASPAPLPSAVVSTGQRSADLPERTPNNQRAPLAQQQPPVAANVPGQKSGASSATTDPGRTVTLPPVPETVAESPERAIAQPSVAANEPGQRGNAPAGQATTPQQKTAATEPGSQRAPLAQPSVAANEPGQRGNAPAGTPAGQATTPQQKTAANEPSQESGAPSATPAGQLPTPQQQVAKVGEPEQLASTSKEQLDDIPLPDKPVAQEPPLSPAQAKARAGLIADIRAELATRGIQTEVDEANGRIFLPQGLNFAYGSSKLSQKGSEELNHLAKTLQKVLPCYAKTKEGQKASCGQGKNNGQLDAVLIDGFAHPADMGSTRFRYNWLLATSRALQTFVTMTHNEPQLNTLKNERDQSLFRLTGHASQAARKHPQYPRRVELRFRMANP